ncbi:MAG: polyprenyl synthetase family protein, partial [Planctomycetota bacterium]
QALDLEGRADPSFTLERYEEIIRKKTGRYLALGWVGAALIAGWEPERARAFWAVGDHLGPAFQIRDDLLDLTTGKGRGGEVGCDIREGKPSILFAHALCSADLEEKQRCRLLEILGRPRDETGPDDVAWVIELYRLLGSLEFAAQEARRRAARGIDAFCSLEGIPAAGARPIEEIAAYLSERGA